MAKPTAPPTTAPDFVTLISSDGYEFVITRQAANVSGTLRRMLDPKSPPWSCPSRNCTS